MNYPIYLARKLSLTGQGHKRTPATAVATTAVALSVMVMLASIAIVTGFKSEITKRITGFNSHITVSCAEGGEDDNILRLSPNLRNLLDTLSFVREYGLQISMPAILKTPDDYKGIYVRGLPTKSSRNFLASNIVAGKMPATDAGEDDAQLLISEKAARQLGLIPGDKTDIYFMSDEVRVRRLPVGAIYNTHFDSYDDIYVYAPLDLLRSLSGLKPDEGVALMIETDDFQNVTSNTSQLQQRFIEGAARGILPRLYQTDNALNQGANYFRWLSLLDTNVAVVLGLMTAVACITLISGMLIIILDKKKFIGLMKALGMPSRKLRRIFIYLVLRVAVAGMLAGNGIMLVLLLLQREFHIIPLDPEAYYIDFVPVELDRAAVVILNVGVLLIAYLSLVLPSRIISRFSPADLLRSE